MLTKFNAVTEYEKALNDLIDDAFKDIKLTENAKEVLRIMSVYMTNDAYDASETIVKSRTSTYEMMLDWQRNGVV